MMSHEYSHQVSLARKPNCTAIMPNPAQAIVLVRFVHERIMTSFFCKTQYGALIDRTVA